MIIVLHANGLQPMNCEHCAFKALQHATTPMQSIIIVKYTVITDNTSSLYGSTCKPSSVSKLFKQSALVHSVELVLPQEYITHKPANLSCQDFNDYIYLFFTITASKIP